MIATEISRTRLHPTSDEDIRLVRKELEAVLSSSHFTSSKRYPAFLSYVVEKTLQGESAHLKERNLGVEVFNRRPDYDTNSDTIVRFAASEVRKRLALVYNESPVDRLVQIVLTAGSYSPEFFLLDAEDAQASSSEPALKLPRIQAKETSTLTRSMPPRAWRRWSPLLGIAFLVALGWTFRRQFRPTAFDQFWQPMLTSPGPIIISPGAMVFSSALAGATRADKTVDYPYVSLATANSLTDLGARLARNKEPYVIEPSSALTLTEIRSRPVVLLGAYNNDWTPRAVSELRFRFAPQADLKIYDSANPNVSWSRPRSVSYSEAEDFAIVARFHAKLTDSTLLVLAGIGKNGTEAATQFVTDPRYLSSLEQSLPKGWATKNIEFVLKTKVIDGRTGEPTLEAVHVW